VFPYAFPEAKRVLSEAAGHAISWTRLAREAHLPGVSDLSWEKSQKSRIRYVLRRDRNLISAAGVTVTVHGWPEVEDSACELIAAHNARKGEADHPEFVRLRHREWDECPGVQLLAFAARAGNIAGVLTAFAWNGELELYEIGLSGEEGPDRIAAYLALLFHEPMRFAQSRGLRTIRAGTAAETAKAARGAMFRGLYGGVLDAIATTKVAESGD
jgi:hypothetical protein